MGNININFSCQVCRKEVSFNLDSFDDFWSEFQAKKWHDVDIYAMFCLPAQAMNKTTPVCDKCFSELLNKRVEIKDKLTKEQVDEIIDEIGNKNRDHDLLVAEYYYYKSDYDAINKLLEKLPKENIIDRISLESRQKRLLENINTLKKQLKV